MAARQESSKQIALRCVAKVLSLTFLFLGVCFVGVLLDQTVYDYAMGMYESDLSVDGPVLYEFLFGVYFLPFLVPVLNNFLQALFLTVLDELLRRARGRLARGIRIGMKGCAISLFMLLMVMHLVDQVLMHVEPELYKSRNLGNDDAAVEGFSWLTRLVTQPVLSALRHGWSLDIILPYSFVLGFAILGLYYAGRSWFGVKMRKETSQ